LDDVTTNVNTSTDITSYQIVLYGGLTNVMTYVTVAGHGTETAVDAQ